jgi:hypothetical protein
MFKYQAHEEVDNIIIKGEEFNYELSRFKYLKLILKETLRMRPGAPLRYYKYQ